MRRRHPRATTTVKACNQSIVLRGHSVPQGSLQKESSSLRRSREPMRRRLLLALGTSRTCRLRQH